MKEDGDRSLERQGEEMRKDGDSSLESATPPAASKRFKAEPTLKDQMKHCHQVVTLVFCDFCQRLFSSAGKLNAHIIRMHKCDICLDICKDLTEHDLAKHRYLESFVCELCPRLKRFASKGYLYTHIFTAHKQDCLHSCEPCQEAFMNSSESRQHFASEQCIIQTKALFSYATASVYRRTRTLPRLPGRRDSKWFPCSHCGLSFQSESNLQEHINARHLLPVGHKCRSCGKLFPSKNSLQEHTKTEHIQMKLTCHFCMKSFVKGGNFNKHMATEHHNNRIIK